MKKINEKHLLRIVKELIRIKNQKITLKKTLQISPKFPSCICCGRYFLNVIFRDVMIKDHIKNLFFKTKHIFV